MIGLIKHRWFSLAYSPIRFRQPPPHRTLRLSSSSSSSSSSFRNHSPFRLFSVSLMPYPIFLMTILCGQQTVARPGQVRRVLRRAQLDSLYVHHWIFVAEGPQIGVWQSFLSYTPKWSVNGSGPVNQTLNNAKKLAKRKKQTASANINRDINLGWYILRNQSVIWASGILFWKKKKALDGTWC